jgi:hypothetical protein
MRIYSLPDSNVGLVSPECVRSRESISTSQKGLVPTGTVVVAFVAPSITVTLLLVAFTT